MDAIHQINQILKLDLKPHNIEATQIEKKKGKNKFKTLMNSLKKQFKTKYLASKDSAKAFLKALKAIDHASEADIKTFLKDKTINEIL